MQFTDTTQRPWRTLIQAIGGVQLAEHRFLLSYVIPAWNPNITLSVIVSTFDNDRLQQFCTEVMKKGPTRTHGLVNIGAENDQDVIISQWLLD